MDRVDGIAKTPPGGNPHFVSFEHRTTQKVVAMLGLDEINQLRNGRWLNCEVVNWHGAAMARYLGTDRMSVRLLSSTMGQKLLCRKNRCSDVIYDHLSTEERQQAKPRSALTFPKIIIPFCRSDHWVVACIEPEQGIISIFDSRRGRNPPSAMCEFIGQRLLSYVAHQGDNLGGSEKVGRVRVEQVSGLPRQRNNDDCGIYTYERIAKLLGCVRPVECVFELGASSYRAKMMLALMETCGIVQ